MDNNKANPNDVLLAMYKEANQLLTEKVRHLSIENIRLRNQQVSETVCTVKISFFNRL